jgi:hypothetical protein
MLEAHLMSLKHSKLIAGWSDRKILAGEEFDAVIRKELRAATIILFLVSSDFMSSGYIQSVEVKDAMERHGRGARVIPVILRPVLLGGTPFEKLLCLPKDGVPVVDQKWTTRDYAFYDVAKGIKAVVEELLSAGTLTAAVESSSSVGPPGLERHAGSSGLVGTTEPAVEFLPRCLDTGVAEEIPIGETREVLAWIRRPGSSKLASYLTPEESKKWMRSYSVRPEDINSTEFTAPFPVGREAPGREMRVLQLRIELLAQGVEVTDSPAHRFVPRDEDPSAASFLIRSATAGTQSMKVKVTSADAELVAELLRTNFVSHGGPSGGSGPAGGKMWVEVNDQGEEVVVLAEAEIKATFVPKVRTATADAL